MLLFSSGLEVQKPKEWISITPLGENGCTCRCGRFTKICEMVCACFLCVHADACSQSLLRRYLRLHKVATPFMRLVCKSTEVHVPSFLRYMIHVHIHVSCYVCKNDKTTDLLYTALVYVTIVT